MRVRSVLFGFVLALGVVGVSSVASGNAILGSQADAYSSCLAYVAPVSSSAGYHCFFVGLPEPGGGSVSCPGKYLSASHYRVDSASQADVGPYFFWCVPISCNAGDTPDGTTPYTLPGFDLSDTVHDRGGCCYSFNLLMAGQNTGDPSSGYSTGYWVGTGQRCSGSFGAAGETSDQEPLTPARPPPPPKPCAGSATGSCYDPWGDQFCASTDAGEQICEPRKPDADNCASGATGSMCIGKDGQPQPAPSDPPIKKDTPPSDTQHYETKDGGGNTYNYQQNVYNGTSPGGSGSEQGAPGSSSPGGTGSNQSGSGNSGSKGTDADGKCPDGKVPTASGCSGTYRDDGCDTPPACYGDAVLCGIAANTHKTACAEAASGSSSGGSDGGALDGLPGDASGVSSSVDLGSTGDTLDASGFGYSTTCPIKDLSFSVMGSQVNIPLQDKCDLLAFLRYVVLGLAYFVAVKIIAGVR